MVLDLCKTELVVKLEPISGGGGCNGVPNPNSGGVPPSPPPHHNLYPWQGDIHNNHTLTTRITITGPHWNQSVNTSVRTNGYFLQKKWGTVQRQQKAVQIRVHNHQPTGN